MSQYKTQNDTKYSTRTVSIEVKGHNHVWDTGTITKNATCTECGAKKYTCTECGETRTETIPKTGHNEIVIRR